MLTVGPAESFSAIGTYMIYVYEKYDTLSYTNRIKVDIDVGALG